MTTDETQRHSCSLWASAADTNCRPSYHLWDGWRLSLPFTLTLYLCPHAISKRELKPRSAELQIWTGLLRKETCVMNRFPSAVILKFSIFLNIIETNHGGNLKTEGEERKRRDQQVGRLPLLRYLQDRLCLLQDNETSKGQAIKWRNVSRHHVWVLGKCL